ncbi:hypothetical protein HpKG127_14350 [Helicobacter pylori]
MKSQQKISKKKKINPPYKIALFKNLNLAPSFPPTKKAKKDFASNPPPQKRGFKKKKEFKKERV